MSKKILYCHVIDAFSIMLIVGQTPGIIVPAISIHKLKEVATMPFVIIAAVVVIWFLIPAGKAS